LRWACSDVSCVERSNAAAPASPLGRTACKRLRCVASMSGPTIPDARDALTSEDADQAAVLS
jgi:hypothetical protein